MQPSPRAEAYHIPGDPYAIPAAALETSERAELRRIAADLEARLREVNDRLARCVLFGDTLV